MTENEAIRLARQEIRDRMNGEDVGTPVNVVFHQQAGKSFNLPSPLNGKSCYEVKFKRDPARRFMTLLPSFVSSDNINVIVFSDGESHITEGNHIRQVFFNMF
jgi:hypothetical protein